MIVGLTGGIGSGKSSVASRLAEHGITIVNADQISRDVVEPGQPALKAIATHFGNAVLNPDGTMNRAWLRERIFSSPEEKSWLESLLHPLIVEETQRRLQTSPDSYVVLESPLLIEMGQDGWCDRVLVVDAPEELQIERSMKRDGNTREQIERIIASQASRETRNAKATELICNDSTLEALIEQTDTLHQRYLAMATTTS